MVQEETLRSMRSLTIKLEESHQNDNAKQQSFWTSVRRRESSNVSDFLDSSVDVISQDVQQEQAYNYIVRVDLNEFSRELQRNIDMRNRQTMSTEALHESVL